MAEDNRHSSVEFKNDLSWLSRIERDRISQCFQRLLPELTAGKFAMTGGINLAYQLTQRGLTMADLSVNDIDFVAENVDVVRPGVTREFLVSHYHPPEQGNSKFFVQLGDPLSRLRIDVFPYLSSSHRRTQEVQLGNWKVPLVSLEDLFVRKVALLQDLSASCYMELKHYEHVAILQEICDFETANAIWNQSLREIFPSSFSAAVEELERLRKEHPGWVMKRNARLKAEGPPCRKCIPSTSFPLAPKDQLFAIWGYV